MSAGQLPETLYADGRWYDRVFAGEDERAAAFHVKQSERAPGTVLVLACGTGRIAVPLAVAGRRVIGIDRNAGMLAVAQRRAEAAGVAADWRIGDMRTFAVDEPVGLVVIAGNSLAHLQTAAELGACLACVQRCLGRTGRLVIDGYVPDVRLLARGPEERRPFAMCDDPADGEPVRVAQATRYDAARQVQHWTLFVERAGEERAREWSLALRMWFPQELEAMLVLHGWRIVERFGGHDESAFDERAGKQILVVTRA